LELLFTNTYLCVTKAKNMTTTTISKGQVATKSDIDNLMIGDIVPNCFGEMAEITKIHHKGIDINGNAFACFYQRFGSGDGANISNTIRESESVFTIK
jgi:hypothetical protein